MKTQLLRGRNAKMQECRSARAQKCRKVTVFCTFALLHFCFAFSILAQTPTPDFTDSRDGQTYKTVLMPDGKRWMAENLRYRKGLNNPIFGYLPTTGNIAAPGTNLQRTYYCPGPGPFPTSPNTTTTSQADPLRCEYEGALYPFWTAYGQNNGTSAVTTTNAGEQGVCPDGWHLPGDGEWTALATQLSNNFSSLQVLNAGRRDYTGIYADRTSKAYFWTSSGSGTAAVSRSFLNGAIARNASQPASDALSVRCVGGGCSESLPITFTVVPYSCEIITAWNEICVFPATRTRQYNLSVPGTSGNWTYTINVTSHTTSSAPTISIAGNGTASPSVTFTISNPVPGQTFSISATASNNSLYCKTTSTTATFKLTEMPTSSTTITGSESTYAVRTLTDNRDCKTYSIIKMANGQWWMKQNLNYQAGLTFYSASNQPFTSSTNGVPGIGAFWCPGAVGATSSSLSDCNTWGALYIWECVVSKDGKGAWVEPSASRMYTGSGSGNPASVSGRGICPPGWHVPSDGEWGEMLNTVETGTKDHNTGGEWAGTNAGVFINSYFSVSAASSRLFDGSSFYQRGAHVFFWTTSGSSSNSAWYRIFTPGAGKMGRRYDLRTYGMSVLCVKD